MRRLLTFLITLTLAAPAAACLWDYDTLQMERERFPGALELIVGKFLRHSDTFYEWRVKDRTAKLAAVKSGVLELGDEELARVYDDLAVAHDKLGEHDKAIEAIREKADRFPNTGQYESHANLGTFLVHAGRYEEGLAELRKAIEINPDAHFGREKYQILLVEYVMENRKESGRKDLPLDGSPRSGNAAKDDVYGFAQFIFERAEIKEWQADEKISEAALAELESAIKSVLGMMRFGDFRSPILLEALGDLLLSGTNNTDSKQLAARAYLRASATADEEAAKARYREMANDAVFGQEGRGGWSSNMSLEKLEDQLAREVKEADTWFAEVADDEELWVTASPDPDRRFWEKYGNQTIQVGHDRLPAGKFVSKGLPVWIRIGLASGFAITALVVVGALLWRRKRPTGYEVREREHV